MERDFEKILKAARRVSLSYDEKDSVRHVLKTALGMNDAILPNRFKFLNFRFAIAAIGAFVIVGTSVSFAAESALPGSPLYAVKDFNERMSGYLTLNPEARALWQVKLADRRLEETEKLSNKGLLNENTRTELEFKFETNANQFNKEIRALRLENKLRRAGELASKLESVMERRKKAFSDIAENEDGNNANSEINVILNKVNLRSEKLMDERREIEAEQNIEIEAVLD